LKYYFKGLKSNFVPKYLILIYFLDFRAFLSILAEPQVLSE